jgi:protein-tyrosine phosphatase
LTLGAPPDGPARILIVCTANRCRSPLAAALLGAALAEHGETAEIDTAGLGAQGRAATDETMAVAARRDLDLAAHRSRTLEPTLVARADIVLGMERVHVREVVAADPSAWPRTFTLKELVRRGEAVGAQQPGETLAAWLARVGEGRQSRDLLGASPLDDVADPSGRPIGDHEDLAHDLEDLLGRLANLLRPDLQPPIRWLGS